MKPVGARGVEPSEKARAAAVHRRGQAGGEAKLLTTPRRVFK